MLAPVYSTYSVPGSPTIPVVTSIARGGRGLVGPDRRARAGLVCLLSSRATRPRAAAWRARIESNRGPLLVSNPAARPRVAAEPSVARPEQSAPRWRSGWLRPSASAPVGEAVRPFPPKPICTRPRPSSANWAAAGSRLSRSSSSMSSRSSAIAKLAQTAPPTTAPAATTSAAGSQYELVHSGRAAPASRRSGRFFIPTHEQLAQTHATSPTFDQPHTATTIGDPSAPLP